MGGICLTAAYEISAPVNSEKSEAVYNQAHGENLSVKEVKALFNDSEEKKPKKDDLKQEQEKESSPSEYKEKIQQVATDLIDNVMQGQSDKFKLEVLEKAIQFLKKRV